MFKNEPGIIEQRIFIAKYENLTLYNINKIIENNEIKRVILKWP